MGSIGFMGSLGSWGNYSINKMLKMKSSSRPVICSEEKALEFFKGVGAIAVTFCDRKQNGPGSSLHLH